MLPSAQAAAGGCRVGSAAGDHRAGAAAAAHGGGSSVLGWRRTASGRRVSLLQRGVGGCRGDACVLGGGRTHCMSCGLTALQHKSLAPLRLKNGRCGKRIAVKQRRKWTHRRKNAWVPRKQHQSLDEAAGLRLLPAAVNPGCKVGGRGQVLQQHVLGVCQPGARPCPPPPTDGCR